MPGDSIEVLLDTKLSGFEGGLRQIVHDSATFAGLWRTAHAREMWVSPLPHVDFAKDEVIVVAMGMQLEPGSMVRIRKVEGRDFVLAVFVELSQRHGCIAPTAASFPVVMVRHRRNVELTPIFYDHFSFTAPC